ncbi:hypothetical protein K5549_005549 [Capra hircus]|nr:hypothetical protein K5549_005549 [Capra hircus]
MDRHGAWTGMGLEKVGMYIKTVTGGNVVHQDSRIQIQQLKRKLQSLEQKGHWWVKKAQLEQSVKEKKDHMEKLEGYGVTAQGPCKAVSEHLQEAQAQYQALEHKYSKAECLIKDYQQETNFLKKKTA